MSRGAQDSLVEEIKDHRKLLRACIDRGLYEPYVDSEGNPGLRLTAKGKRKGMIPPLSEQR